MSAITDDVARAVVALAAATNNPLPHQAQIAQAQISATNSQQTAISSTAPQNASLPQYSVPGPVTANSSKYNQLLALIEELGKDIRPTYTGNRNCAERLKRGIIHARVLVRECLHEIEKNARQSAATAASSGTATTSSQQQ